jgi:hypothetical protein
MADQIALLSDHATKDNLQKMMKFLGWFRCPVPTFAIPWPPEIIAQYGENIDFTYVASSHKITCLSRREEQAIAASFFEPTNFFLRRVFIQLLDDSNRKLHRLATQIDHPYASFLLCRLYKLNFLKHKHFRD